MIYQGEYTKEISFPLGGIGSGSIGLAGNGQLIDWEIFNRPAKGSRNGHTHFAVKAKTKNGVVTRVLQGDLLKDYTGQYGNRQFSGFGFGPSAGTMCAFPHFSKWTFKGEFPVAEIDFADDHFPGEVTLQAFNPFIPLDEDNSSIPGAFFEIQIHNTSEETIEYQTAFSVQNPWAVAENISEKQDGCKTLSFVNKEVQPQDTGYGDMTIATDCKDTLVQTYWYRGAWQDTIVTFWNNFNNEKDLQDRVYETADNNVRDHGTLVAGLQIGPGETRTMRFVLTWNMPNNYNYWNDKPDENGKYKSWKNYYAVLFGDSVASARYALENWEMLKEKTLAFRDVLHRSSLDEAVIDAASSTLSVLKSPTVLRLEDGSFYGWEGVHETAGSCEGTCQHVWNYAYALCFLFPRLERSIRENEFKYTVKPDGQSIFRLKLPLENNPGGFRACVDGQMGIVIKSYREWKISGDDEWLKRYWEQIKLVLDYARSEDNFDRWDYDGDGVLEGRQHHTLDMELFGPSGWLEGMYLAALKAAAEMAEYLGEADKAAEYRELFDKGYQWTRENLFNGSYFIQQIDLTDKSIPAKFDALNYWNEETGEIKYQIGQGSSIDQLLGQWHANLVALGDICDPDQVKTALQSMYRINFRSSMREFANPWRVFSLNDEGGTIICGYPEEVYKPCIPIPYCEETMTGFEYQFAAMLIYNGMIDEGLSVVRAIRDRYDGKKRNPYNEIECGSNYARAMASFSLLPAFSGMEYDLAKGYLGFDPVEKKEKFRCLFSLGTGWGEFVLDEQEATVQLMDGYLELGSFKLGKAAQSLGGVLNADAWRNPEVLQRSDASQSADASQSMLSGVLEIDGKPVECTLCDDVFTFEKQAVHQALKVKLKK